MMNWRIGAAVVLAAGALCGFDAQAQVNPDAAAVLKQSSEAILKLGGVSYKSKLYGVGALKDIMDGEGEVKQIRTGAANGRHAPVWIKGEVKELGKGKAPITVSTDGTTVEWIDDVQNTHFKRSIADRAGDGSRVMSLGSQLVLNEFNETDPYAKQLKAQKVELKPNEKVHDVDCQVVLVSWEDGLRSETWWIGANDHLPHKIEMAHGQARDLAKGTEIWDVQILDKPTVADIALKTPAGYKDDVQISPTITPKPAVQPQNSTMAPPPPPVVGLAPGSQAPEFDLHSGDGKSVKLSSLKGSVVVLTFGGSKFPKTATVNTAVSNALGSFAGKDVKAYALSCREDSEQAAMDHAKQAKLGFPLLLGADNVRNDYKVAGFPFTYVLTADGRVSKGFQGPVNAAQLQQAIDAALKGEIAPVGPSVVPAVPPSLTPAPNPAGKLPNLSPTKK